MIEVHGLKYVYENQNGNPTTALNGIDLVIPKGQFVAVIGANGCGKSTLARHFNALLLPTEGRVLVDGLDTAEEANLWTIRQKAGMVFQNPDNQIVAAVVEEDVAFGPENIGLPQVEICQRVADALFMVGMTDYAKHAPHKLSGGQKQRVAIAGLLALQPEYLILDEPTAMLDPGGRREILNIVQKLNREKGMTVVYITHYMAEALAADRVIVMQQGRIAFEGSPQEVFSRVDELEKLGLEAPLAAEVAAELNRKKLRVSGKVITAQQLAEALCP